MQAVSCPAPPSQQYGVQALPPSSRGRTNSLTFPRRQEAGEGGGPYVREEGRGARAPATRAPPPPAPGSRRGVEEDERRARRGGAERRLSAPSSRGGPGVASQSDQAVIDHMVNLGECLLPPSLRVCSCPFSYSYVCSYPPPHTAMLQS